MQKNNSYTSFLPTTKKELKLLGWETLDVILFTGDAYIDHPSFGSAVIGRVLESMGLKVAIIPQPNWRDDLRDFKKLGKPNLFFGVTSGCMDSMVNHYTANRRLRSNDAYTPEGRSGQRPDYATKVYSNILKDLYPDTPVIIGGIEASLRRFVHYDYWEDSLKQSMLLESKADMLVYGMGEKSIIEIANQLKDGKPISDIKDVNQTAYISTKNSFTIKEDDIELFDYDTCLNNKRKFAENFLKIEKESNKYEASRLVQRFKNNVLVVNPQFPPMTEKEIDEIYDLPYTRLPHPKYRGKAAIPAYDMIKHSINIHRGCFGGCSFCTISAHQGKFIASRSEKSILNELDKVCEMPDFKGYISDLGGPSANMYKMQGVNLDVCKKCERYSCIYPNVCNNLDARHDRITELYRKARNNRNVKKIFIGSGIRYDIFIKKPELKGNKEYPEEVIRHHVSGRLKVAPEHTNNNVLKAMRKPEFSCYLKFHKMFNDTISKHKIKQQIIPYFISSHPGCKNIDMAELTAEVKNLNLNIEQVQDFTPTPMTLSTVIYYSGFNPYTNEKVFIPKGKDKQIQQKMFFWYKKENQNIIKKEILKAGRQDLLNRIFSKSRKRR